MKDKMHLCLACAKQLITYRFAICRKCEQLYGRSALGWDQWLRFAWSDEVRMRRKDALEDEHTFYYDYESSEEVFDYVPDGHSFFISNRNERRYENLSLLDLAIDELDDEDRLIVQLRICGYTLTDIEKITGFSRQVIRYKLDHLDWSTINE